MHVNAAFFAALRAQFPALSRKVNGQPAICFDGPAGTQVPQRVIAAISHHLTTHNANHGGSFATSAESDAILDEAQKAPAKPGRRSTSLGIFMSVPDAPSPALFEVALFACRQL